MAGFCVHLESLSNNKIKEIKKLHLKKYRDEYNLFIAEGKKALEDIIHSSVEIIAVYAIKEVSYKNAVYISEDDMKKISTTSSPCEVLTIAKKKVYDINSFEKLNSVVLIDSVSDPGNLGTIIRSACAFGMDGIVLFSDCTDMYSSKVIRSAVGNFFKIPIIQLKEICEIKKYFKSHKIISTSLSKNNNITLKNCSKLDKKIIMFGSEANGLSKELESLSDYNIKLDMQNNVESLNLAVCASIVMYEIFDNN